MVPWFLFHHVWARRVLPLIFCIASVSFYHTVSLLKRGWLSIWFFLQFMIHMYLLHVYVVTSSGGFYVAANWAGMTLTLFRRPIY